jgi:DNA-binding beta-propeller fold protein YncE
MRNKILIALSALMFSLPLAPSVLATELPSGVLSYLKQKDPGVTVRFDGLVTFSNGETYVPVIPQDPALNPEPQQVIASVPAKAAYPDLVEFDNHFFLLRLIQTASGRLTFPKMVEYPLQLKEGLLPQDFLLPSNLFIPVELKVILGGLPYNPSFASGSPVEPGKSPVVALPAAAQKQPELPPLKPPTQRNAYVFDLTEQKVLAIDATNGRRIGDVVLDCVPSSLRVSQDGTKLFAPCLSTNELAVVDTGSNLVKTRVPVGQRPDAILYIEKSQEVVVSNRYSPFLSVIDGNTLQQGDRITLPGNGGAMAEVPNDPEHRIVVADAAKPQLYVVNVQARTVERTLKSLPNVSALWVGWDARGQMELWTASRSKRQVQIMDPLNGTVSKTLDVGAKPVEFAAFGNRIYVVAAGSDRLDVIERGSKQLLDPVNLPEGSFPASMMTLTAEKRAYVTTAGTNNLVVVDLESGALEKTIPVEFRASMITMTPDAEADHHAVSTGPQQSLPAVEKPQEGSSEKDQKAGSFMNKGFSLFGKSKPQAKQGQAPEVKSEKQDASNSVAYPLGSKRSNAALPAQNSPKLTIKLGKGKSKKEAQSSSQTDSPKTIGPSESVPAAIPTTLQGADATKTDAPPPMIEEIHN